MARVILIALAFFLQMSFSFAGTNAKLPTLPKQAYDKIPILKEEIDKHWPAMPLKSSIAAQIEQESCISLKHSKCWNSRAELKTDREYGFGLGQITITKKFNVFEELKASSKALSDWKWENRFDPRYQIRAVVIKDFQDYSRIKGSATTLDRLAFAYSAYNGGLGGVLKDRKLCSYTKGCDSSKWFGHVENTSYKSKVALKGYGQSFFEINRGYVKHLIELQPRRAKYVPYLDT